jgi:uncharacterized repeat protein (TIGR03803 family)
MNTLFLENFLRRVRAALSVALVLSAVSQAATYKKLYSFTGGTDGGDPSSRLTFDSAGNAYGTTAAGGAYGFGTVFMLTPSGQEQVLWSFTGGGDGLDPHGGVTLDSAGNLYGTAVAGGFGGFCSGDGCGVVYELSQSGGTWTETTLYSFRGLNDGFGPGSGLIFDSAGNLYGSAPDGGAHAAGVVFQLSPSSSGWQYKVIHTFTGGNDGAVGSLGLLLLDAAGNIYGAAELGGAHGAGTVYELSPSTRGPWSSKVLYQFNGTPDAANPYGGLIFDAAGNLYGTTYYGGQNGMGAVFQLSPSLNGKWQENILYNFQGGTDGSAPTSALVFNGAGVLYGTTTTGGRPSCDCGTIFKLTPSHGTWKEVVIHPFGLRQDGSYPNYELTIDKACNFYGTTPVGGTGGAGIVFEYGN